MEHTVNKQKSEKFAEIFAKIFLFVARFSSNHRRAEHHFSLEGFEWKGEDVSGPVLASVFYIDSARFFLVN
jgi:hypothetical protein